MSASLLPVVAGRAVPTSQSAGVAAGTIAAAGGLLIAQLGIRFLVNLAPADIPRLSGAALNAESFGFAAGTALAGALACSILPAWLVTRTNLDSALRGRGARSSISRPGTVCGSSLRSQVSPCVLHAPPGPSARGLGRHLGGGGPAPAV